MVNPDEPAPGAGAPPAEPSAQVAPAVSPPPVVVVEPRPVETVNVPLGPRLARIEISFELAPGERVQLLVEAAHAADGQGGVVLEPVVVRSEPVTPQPALAAAPSTAAVVPSAAPVRESQPISQRVRASLAAWEARAAPWWAASATLLLGVSLVVYLLTRLWGIDRFPIFFYSDEANNVLLGEAVLQNGLRGSDGTWLPVYFEADSNRWTPVLSTYIQAASALLFGKSIFVARATSAIFSVGAAVAIAWLLKRFFQARFWWASPLLLALTPAWFLYSRTAFEIVMVSTFFALFLLAYAYYRCVSPKYILVALPAGAAAFYGYSNAQLVVGLLAIALLLSDWDYHRKSWRSLVLALPVAALLAWPLVRFRWLHAEAIGQHLSAVDSYWTHALPLWQKLLRYGATYLHGLSPAYWGLAENGESRILPNQHFGGQGHLGWLVLGLLVVGLAVGLRRFRVSPLHRLVVLALLVAPAGAALDTIEIARVLVMVIPAVVLALLGLEWLLSRARAPRYGVAAAGVLGLGLLLSLGTLRTALVNGPLWSDDYGLYGAQYGVKQIFEDSLPVLLREAPARQFRLTTGWANNTHMFARFFLTPAQREQVSFVNIADYLTEPRDLPPETVFVLTAAEFEQVQSSGALLPVETLRQIAFPNGQPAFVITRLAYAPDAAAVFAAQALERQQLQEADLVLAGQTVHVRHTAFDEGGLATLFDGNLDSVARGSPANPFIVELHFPAPRLLSGVAVKVGSTPDVTLTAAITDAGGTRQQFSAHLLDSPQDPTVELSLGDTPLMVSVLRLEVRFNQANDRTQIHIWEVELR